jgi:hypothetical protein
MLGLLILLAVAIGCGIAALRIWEYPEWPRQILATIAVLDTLTVAVIGLRRVWSRRAAMVLLGGQIVLVDTVLVIAAAMLIRDNPTNLAGSISLIMFLFLPGVVADTALTLLAARSINNLRWPEA